MLLSAHRPVALRQLPEYTRGMRKLGSGPAFFIRSDDLSEVLILRPNGSAQRSKSEAGQNLRASFILCSRLLHLVVRRLIKRSQKFYAKTSNATLQTQTGHIASLHCIKGILFPLESDSSISRPNPPDPCRSSGLPSVIHGHQPWPCSPIVKSWMSAFQRNLEQGSPRSTGSLGSPAMGELGGQLVQVIGST